MAGKNEGEGSRSAARRYNDAAHETAERSKGANPAPASDEERREMEKAEQEGRARAKEIDPAVDRDFEKPAR